MELPETDLHVWQIPLRRSAEEIAALRLTLAPDELRRADRFYFDDVRRRFTIARGVLRAILAAYLQIEPVQVVFNYNPNGKPLLSRNPGWLDLRFNLSHSGDLALCGCALGRDIGIDVEALQEIRSADQIAKRYFAPEEYATYRSLPDAKRREGFYLRWTMKEAYIKARGSGLSLPLDAFSITSTPDASGFHRVRSVDFVDDRRWNIVRLARPPDTSPRWRSKEPSVKSPSTSSDSWDRLPAFTTSDRVIRLFEPIMGHESQ